MNFLFVKKSASNSNHGAGEIPEREWPEQLWGLKEQIHSLFSKDVSVLSLLSAGFPPTSQPVYL